MKSNLIKTEKASIEDLKAIKESVIMELDEAVEYGRSSKLSAPDTALQDIYAD